MKIRTILYTALFGLGLLTASCVGDLDQMPTTETTSSEVYAQASNYRMVLAKIYASYVLAGQGQGGADGDLTTINGQDFSRGYFNLQEAATDEVANTWLSGNNLSDLTYISWSEKDSWVSDSYYWLYFNISLCNEFLRHCTESEIARFEASEQSEIRTYRAEARFMRALSYWMVLDLYRQGPKVDENTPVSGYIPEAFDGPELFDFIESELTTLVDDASGQALPDTNEYGRAGKPRSLGASGTPLPQQRRLPRERRRAILHEVHLGLPRDYRQSVLLPGAGLCEALQRRQPQADARDSLCHGMRRHNLRNVGRRHLPRLRVVRKLQLAGSRKIRAFERLGHVPRAGRDCREVRRRGIDG